VSKLSTKSGIDMRVSAWPSACEWWQALCWVYLTFTFLIVLTMAGSFVSYERVITNGHPWLPNIYCKGCMFCGMTRSFCAMSNGLWQEAAHWNRGGPVLYVGGWLWLISGAAIFIKVARRDH
jgi:hypothetical protein